jgi:hypothetical protein
VYGWESQNRGIWLLKIPVVYNNPLANMQISVSFLEEY